MKKREEKKYFDKEWKDMEIHLKSFLNKEQQEDDLHRFRVQVKKLQAFLILSDSIAGRSKLIKYFKPVKKVFKQAGEIRNAYINLELGNARQTNNNAFMTIQHQSQEKTTREFKLKGEKHLEKIKGVHKTIKSKIKPINDVHIDLFYQNQLYKIAGPLTELKFNDQLHECRKLIKILIYNHKLAQTAMNTGVNEDYLDQVQIAIGDWHDNILAMKLFLNGEVKDQATDTRLKKEGIKLKKDIAILSKDFYNQATTVVNVPVEQID